MARTQAEDYEDKRLSIERHAADLFAAQGFHGTAISDIARACGMSKPSLYHYFTSKEEILFAVMDDHITLLLSITEDIKTHTQLANEDKLRQLCRLFMEAYVDAASRHVVLLNEMNALPPARESTIRARQNVVVENIVEIITAINPGLAQRKDLKKPAAMIFMGMINWTHTWFAPNGYLSPSDFADMACDVFLGGFAGAGEDLPGSPRKSLTKDLRQ